jgi:NAD+ kinase
MRTIKTVGIVVKPHAPNIGDVLAELMAFLEGRRIGCLLEAAAAEKLGRSDGFPREDLPSRADLIVVLGGDGTLLSVARASARTGAPVMGVNLGNLGFLTEVPVSEMIQALEALLSGNEAIVSPRWLLEARLGEKVFHCLNDAVINKSALARMVQMRIWVDGLELAVPRADGLIVATPTGSTAYSLSAGGPILQPHIPAFIIAPICPHTLTFRPMVVSSSSVVRVQLLTGGEEVYLTLDGQRGVKMEKGDEVEVRRSPLELRLISSPRRNYFRLLKEKLGWGE